MGSWNYLGGFLGGRRIKKVKNLWYVMTRKCFLSPQLPLEDLQSQYEIEYKKLKEMAPDATEEPSEQRPKEKGPSPGDLWEKKLPEIVESIREIITEGT